MLVKLKVLQTTAMKEKNSVMKNALRNLFGEIDRLKGSKLEVKTDDQAYALIKKTISQNKESMEFLKDAPHLEAENEFLQTLLPKVIEAKLVPGLVADAITVVGAKEMSDMGKVMGKLKADHGAALDARYASMLVREALCATQPN